MTQSIYQPDESLQNTLFIIRTLKLPIATVWKAWSEAESLTKWWGPKDFTCPVCRIDFRVGGKYLACMQAPDGKQFWSTGEYQEIVSEKKLVMTDSFSDSMGNLLAASEVNMPGKWPLELQVTVKFEASGNQTKLSIQHVGIPQEMQKECTEGWQQSFDKMENNLR